MAWLPRQLTNGVVLTRSENLLNDGELRSAEFCRLQPGDNGQVWPDWDYEPIAGSWKADKVLVQRIITFDDLDDPHILMVSTRAGVLTVFRILTFDGELAGAKVVVDQASEATVISRGAEYFIGSDVGNFVLDSTLEFREMGLDQSDLVVSVKRNSTLQLVDDFRNSDFMLGPLTFTTFKPLIQDIYSKYGEGLEATRLANEMIRRFRGALFTNRGESFFQTYMPIREVRLTAPGSASIGGYWLTEYYSGKGVESAPTELSDSWFADPDSLVLEFDVDVRFLLENWNLVRNQLDGTVNELTDEDYTAYREWVNARDATVLVNLEVPDLMKDAIGTVDVEWAGSPSSADVDKLRLYRGVFRQLPNFELWWDPESDTEEARVNGDVSSATDGFLESVADGRIVLTGGLLNELDATDTSYQDNTRSSGVANPTPSYPTVNYYDQGSLGVYQYLQKPPPFSVGANMGGSLLVVPKDNEQIIRMTPVKDPENAPPIYIIPVVSQNQDKIVSIKALRDFAVVFTTTATLRLNYLPFETSLAQDRVLSQISDFHGALSQRLITTVETQSGQMIVWLSHTGLMGTDGFGFRDMCPDFSIATSGLDLADYADWSLTNNVKDYRIELWVGGTRWDFYYHPTQMKDVRGDGLGLSMKLMGPSQFWTDRNVVSASSSVVDDLPITLIATLKDGSVVPHKSSESMIQKQSRTVTGSVWGSNPVTALRTDGVGLQYKTGTYYSALNTTALCYDIDGKVLTGWAEDLDLNRVKGFSYGVPSNGLGEGAYYSVLFKGGPVGPLWLKLEEYGSGFGN